MTDAIDSTTAARTLNVDLNCIIAKNVDEREWNAKGREKLNVLVSAPTVLLSLAFYTSLMLAINWRYPTSLCSLFPVGVFVFYYLLIAASSRLKGRYVTEMTRQRKSVYNAPSPPPMGKVNHESAVVYFPVVLSVGGR